MIDIVKAVQDADPSLGSYVLVLRGDSRALSGADGLSAAAADWIAHHAPGARLARVAVRLAPHPGGVPAERSVNVLAFADPRQLAGFATAWTAEPEAPAAPAA